MSAKARDPVGPAEGFSSLRGDLAGAGGPGRARFFAPEPVACPGRPVLNPKHLAMPWRFAANLSFGIPPVPNAVFPCVLQAVSPSLPWPQGVFLAQHHPGQAAVRVQGTPIWRTGLRCVPLASDLPGPQATGPMPSVPVNDLIVFFPVVLSSGRS